MNERSFDLQRCNINDSRGERTRQSILAAAYKLFISQGYHGTSMRQIAHESGVALGGLYNHFQGKAEVFEAVLEAFHPYHEIVPALLAAQGETIEAFVRDAALRLQQGLENSPYFLNLMFIEIVEFNSLHLGKLFVTIFPEGLKVSQRMIQVGGSRLRPLPVELLMRSFMGLFFSYYITGILFKQVWPSGLESNSLDQFVEIYLHGILVEEPPAPAPSVSE